jgi:hypothetical protein
VSTESKKANSVVKVSKSDFSGMARLVASGAWRRSENTTASRAVRKATTLCPTCRALDCPTWKSQAPQEPAILSSWLDAAFFSDENEFEQDVDANEESASWRVGRLWVRATRRMRKHRWARSRGSRGALGYAVSGSRTTSVPSRAVPGVRSVGLRRQPAPLQLRCGCGLRLRSSISWVVVPSG